MTGVCIDCIAARVPVSVSYMLSLGADAELHRAFGAAVAVDLTTLTALHRRISDKQAKADTSRPVHQMQAIALSGFCA